MQDVIQFVYDYVLSIVMMVLLIIVGVFLTTKTKALQFRKFGYMSKNTIGSLFEKKQHAKESGSVSPFQAVTTALAGTIGTGSIAGVATALVSGGPGAVFWMWVSALLGMITKYAEIVLSLKYREKNTEGAWVGGPMYYMKNGLNNKSLAIVFSVFAMIACTGIGNTTQANSIANVVETTLKVPTWITGIIITVIVALVILGGMKRIASVNEKLVPAMAVFFITCALIVLGINVEKIPAAVSLIFSEAFNLNSLFGGVAGYTVFSAMRYGVGRGVFTNEAGLGSAPIAHAASSTKEPVRQGLWGMFEVFITTIIICTMSALVILTSDVYSAIFTGVGNASTLSGAALSGAAFNEGIPVVGEWGVAIATIFFSLSTIFGWAYYGEVCAGFLFKNHRKTAITVYRIFYVAVAFVGAVANLNLVWLIADVFNVLMALPNLIALFALSKVVVSMTKEHFDKKEQSFKPIE